MLLLDKPLGLSSNDALQKVKRLFRAEKAGHTGTLDPLATGLLPLCFGAATKFSQVSLDADKRYTATLRLGVTTTTADAEGEVLETRPVQMPDGRPISPADIEAVCGRFVGQIKQLPPMYSALKRDGKALYEYARAGIEVEREARAVTIFSIKVLDVAGGEIGAETPPTEPAKATAESLNGGLPVGGASAPIQAGAAAATGPEAPPTKPAQPAAKSSVERMTVGGASAPIRAGAAPAIAAKAAPTAIGANEAPALITLDIRCSKGTYIRTLAEDIGKALGCGAHLAALRRTETGPLTLVTALTLAQLEQMDEPTRDATLLPADILLADWPTVRLAPEDAARFLNGVRRRLPLSDAPHVRVYGPEPKAFLGSGHIAGGELISDRLLSPVEVQGLLDQPFPALGNA
ncbi:tRNA pseudouridine(55) synthase TruB [Piscinibacter sakaiensis]|uniref:tRNA pseudouridine(55) synthase TruB n=1 Tax=Piscinibacter sakaiensis TaxID=1547922 RepID=UPI003AAFB331